MGEAAKILRFAKETIDAVALERVNELAANTARKYTEAWRQFKEWNGGLPDTMTAKEADLLLAEHARYLHKRTSARAKNGMAPKTIYLHASGIKWFYQWVYGISPRNDLFLEWKLAWKGISRKGRERGTGQRTGLSLEQVREVAELAPTIQQGLSGYRSAAMLKMMFFGLLRANEAEQVDCEHIDRHEDGSATLYIPASKTDQSGKGAHAFLPSEAVEAIDHWLELAGIDSGPVLVSIAGPGAYERNRLTKNSINWHIKRLAVAAGYVGDGPNNYGSHSCRVGMAQHLARKGVSDVRIMHAGRWSNVNMVAQYTKGIRPQDGAVAQLFAGV